MRKFTPVLLGSCVAMLLMIGCTTTNYIGTKIKKPTMFNGASAIGQKFTVVKSLQLKYPAQTDS